MSALDDIKAQQRAWAVAHGLNPDSRGYLDSVVDNLLVPMTPTIHSEFIQGDGSELDRHKDGTPPKMAALHSSSTLAYNVFGYWRTRDLQAIGAGLGAEFPVMASRFEEKLATRLRGTPPNLDLVVETLGGFWAVESKFCEPYARRGKSARSRITHPFREAYFKRGKPVWTERGMPQCGALALDLQNGTRAFEHLDAPQLLKHALGLQMREEAASTLVLAYYMVPTAEGAALAAEAGEFRQLVSRDLRFQAVDYQAILDRLRQYAPSGHDAYFRYIEARYGL